LLVTTGRSTVATSSVVLPGDVPIEELASFVAIPICGLLTLEAVRGIPGRSRA
jgi:hypothetical protein